METATTPAGHTPFVTSDQLANNEWRLFNLPADITGVRWHWEHGDVIECIDCIEANPSGAYDTTVVGTLLRGEIECEIHEGDEA